MAKIKIEQDMLIYALESHGELQWYIDKLTGDISPVAEFSIDDDDELAEQV